MVRMNARQNLEVRDIAIKQNVIPNILGSCQLNIGNTKVIAAVEEAKQIEEWVEYPPYIQLSNEDNQALNQVKSFILRQLDLPPLRVGWHILQSDGDLFAASLMSMTIALQLAGCSMNHSLLQDIPRFVALNAGFISGELYLDLDVEEQRKAESIASLILDGEQIALLDVMGNCSINQLNQLLAALSAQLSKLKDSLPQLQEQQNNTLSKEIVIATKNPAKTREFKAMFESEGYTVKTLLDYPELPDVEETGKTFEENARLKADTISRLLNRPVIGDDSGLCVDALDGMPGIYSARYAGDHNNAANNAKLLSEMAGIPELDRTAHYHTTLVFAAPGKDDLVVEGEVEGLIAGIPRGENGFGYDPLFYIPELDKTMAEITPEQKNKISHRAVATAKLKKQWRQWLEG